MIKLIISGAVLYPNAIIMTILFLAVCAFIGWYWKRFCESRLSRTAVFIVSTVLVMIFIVIMIIGMEPDHDEVEHAHAAWQMSQGLLPYTDFFQHHSPVFWILLTPIFKIPALSSYILETIRIISTFLSLAAVVIIIFITKYIWKDDLSIPIVILFIFSHSIAIELYNLRPDLLANIFSVAAFFLLIRFSKAWSYGISGILLGLILTLSPKYWPFIFVLPFIMVLDYKRIFFYLRYLPVHLIGMVVGFIPLIAWLYYHNLWDAFYRWVYLFNVNKTMMGVDRVFKGEFSFILTLFASIGCYQLIKSKNKHQNFIGKHLVVFLLLSICIFLKISRYHLEYYEQLFVLYASVAAAGPFLLLMKKWIAERRTILLCLFIGILIWPCLYKVQGEIRKKAFLNGRKYIQTLQKLAKDETVICIPPYHPICCRDALDINTAWQYYVYFSIPECRNRMSDTVDKIIDKKPAIILNSPDEGFIQHLLDFGIISPEEADSLKMYLDTHYCLMHIQDHAYWIRKDRYEWYQKFQNEF